MVVTTSIRNGWSIKKRDFCSETEASVRQLQKIFGGNLRIRLQLGEGLHISVNCIDDQQRLNAMLIANPVMWPEPTQVNYL